MVIQTRQGIDGFIASDLEITEYPTGKRLSFRLGQEQNMKNDAGEWVKGESEFVDVTMWGRSAERAAEMYKKGDKVLLVGQVRESEYEVNGEKRVTEEFRASYIGPNTNVHYVDIHRGRKAAAREQVAPSVAVETATPPATEVEVVDPEREAIQARARENAAMYAQIPIPAPAPMGQGVGI